VEGGERPGGGAAPPRWSGLGILFIGVPFVISPNNIDLSLVSIDPIHTVNNRYE
jgi:hypothetical protein